MITVTLFEAAEAVDSGPIYKKEHLHFTGLELNNELGKSVVKTTIDPCRFFVDEYPAVTTMMTPQEGEPTFYPKRCSDDSFIDADKTFKEQFNLLRTVDNKKYPAWFEMNGKRFILQIKRAKNSCMTKKEKNN